MNQTTKRRLRLSDLLAVEYPACPALSPDGKIGAFVCWKAEPETGKFTPALWTIDIKKRDAAPLFPDNARRMLPRFSPGGETLYYLSDKGSSPRVYQLWKYENGAETCLTSLRHGISWYSLSADGAQIAFEAPFWLDEGKELAFTPLTGEERTAWEAARARRPIEVTEIMYKFDETYGIPDGSINQLGTLSLETGETRLLTWEEPQHHFPALSPDGKRLACWRFPHGGWQKKRGELTVYTLESGYTQLTDGIAALSDDPPVWMDDETLVYGAYQISGEEFAPSFFTVKTSGGNPEPLPAPAVTAPAPSAPATPPTATPGS